MRQKSDYNQCIVVIENARQKTEGFGLPNEQCKAVMKKITELEELAKSKQSKGKHSNEKIITKVELAF